MTPDEDEKERQFQEYLRRSTPYFDAVRVSGDEPWHRDDIQRRRELFYRRWQKPSEAESRGDEVTEQNDPLEKVVADLMQTQVSISEATGGRLSDDPTEK